MADKTLFGAPGAERLFFTIEDAIEDLGVVGPAVERIDEYDTYPPRCHLPDAGWAAEWAAEWAADNDTDEGWGEQAMDAAKQPDVIAAFDQALGVLASHITYRMANRRIGSYAVSVDDEGTITIGSRWLPCDWCDRDAAWRNANGNACDAHSLKLSQINGGNDAVVGVKDRS